MKSEIKIEKGQIIIMKKGVWKFFILYNVFILIYYFKIFSLKKNYSCETFFKFIAPIFIYYYLRFIYIFSKEKIIIKEESIIIVKKFLFFTIMEQKLERKNIQMIMYRKNQLPYFFEIILFPFYFKNLYNIIFQVEDKEVKYFFCGCNITKKNYNLIKNEIKCDNNRCSCS